MPFNDITFTNKVNTEYIESLKQNLQEISKKIKTLSEQEDIKYSSFITPLMDIEEEINSKFSIIFHLNNVNNSKESVEYELLAQEMLTQYYTDFFQNDTYANIFDKLLNSGDLNPSQKLVVLEYDTAFKLNGIGLPADIKKRIKDINIELGSLSTEFSQNVMKSVNQFSLIVDDEATLSEMPEVEKKSAQQEDNSFKFSLQMPSYIAFMTYVKDRELREKIYKASVTKGEGNHTIIEKLLKLKHEKAQLLKFNNYAELSVHSKAAPSVEAVFDYLNSLLQKGKEQAKKEYKNIESYAKTLGINNMAVYDSAYVMEKLKKEQLSFDENAVRPYFELNNVLDGLFKLLNQLFNLTFHDISSSVDRWHEKVKVYNIEKDNQLIGRVYMDLETREHKRGGAWADNLHTHFIDSNNKQHLPVAYLVCNFSSSTPDNPSLLKHYDVETLYHEMGHVLQHITSIVPERNVSGFNGVKWDVIEMPSQWLQQFAYSRQLLQSFAKHYKTNEIIPDEYINKIIELKNFNAAIALTRQLEFALFDMYIHLKSHSYSEVQEILDTVRKDTSVYSTPAYNRFQDSFEHIFAGGYSAGYYSYKWAENYSSDIFVMMFQDEKIDKEIASRFYDTMLSQGSSQNIDEQFKNFSGKDKPDVDAMLKLSGII